jgi:hypothetical protein
MNRKTITAALAASLLLSGAAFGETVFTLDPVGGAISGYAGQTDLGWGFTFFNDTDFALITSSDYVTGTDLGTFTDYISSDQFVLAGLAPESTSISQTFDSGLLTGVGQFVIDGSAPVGAHSDGEIRITYDLYSLSPNDPSFDPDADLVSSGNVITALASIDVLAAPVTSTPEPGAFWLSLAGLACAASLSLFRKRCADSTRGVSRP